jgi:imidazolonepropionase
MKALACASLITCADGPSPVRGRAKPAVVRGGVLAWNEGRITYAGTRQGFEGEVQASIDDGTIVPGFVDCHTHLPFMGWRDEDWETKLLGEREGEGGIFSAGEMMAAATDDDIIDFCLPLLAEMLAHGTTTVEFRTGYGLTVESELRHCRIARQLGSQIRQNARVNLFVCHLVPRGTSRGDWVDAVCDELIPAAAAERVADCVDVFVDSHVVGDEAFTVADLRRVAAVAEQFGLPVRCQADQLGPSGAAEAAVAVKARSADHLNFVGQEGLAALGAGQTGAVMMPVPTLMLEAQLAPADELLAAGAPLVLASDFNAGNAPVLSIPTVIALACALYRIDPLTALVGSTLNPAWVLDMDHETGSLRPGKLADFLVLDSPDFRMVPYRMGHNPVRAVFVGGELVAGSL